MLAILTTPLAALTLFVAIEIVAGLIVRPSRPQALRDQVTAVVVVPAHNEEAVIGSTLHALMQSLQGSIRVLVVADNCSDSTAQCARELGAEVIERHDPLNRGKGFALAFAAEHLRLQPPDVVAVVDADCRIEKQDLENLVNEAARSGRPCQAVNLLAPDRTATPMVQASGFAFMVKNLLRQRGLSALSGRAHLTGTGMAFPFSLFTPGKSVRSSIVEDLEFGLQLAREGHPPWLVDRAVVLSNASTERGTLTQRTRWEGGYLGTAMRAGIGFIWSGLLSRDWRAMLEGLDLLVPPLALLVILDVLICAAAAVLAFTTDLPLWPPLLLFASLVLLLVVVSTTWIVAGRGYLSPQAFLKLPLYLVWKLPMYAGIARRKEPAQWLRSGR